MDRKSSIAEVAVLALVPAALAAGMVLDVASVALTFAMAVVALGFMFARFERRAASVDAIMPPVAFATVASVARVALAAIPSAKPTTAIVIIAGSVLGPAGGFMTGALSALVSNMVLGQGMWTPWQMYAWGVIGYAAGFLPRSAAGWRRARVLVFGFVSCLWYGLVLNGYYVVGYVRPITVAGTLAAFAAAVPFDLAHAAATAGFLAVLWVPWQDKVGRILKRHGR
jgi:energy-coupling factor transport system substrate-specific component